MKGIDIYTDGSCAYVSKDPAPGGWASIIKFKDHLFSICGMERATFCDRMEMTAVIEALSFFPIPIQAVIYTDSLNIVSVFRNNLVPEWKANKWRGRSGRKIRNIDLWKKLFSLSQKHDLTWVHVQAHTGHDLNERCDELAKHQSSKCKISIGGMKVEQSSVSRSSCK